MTTAWRICLVAKISIAMLATPVQAQSVEDSIVSTVQQFFDGMTARDMAATRRVMVMDGQYHRVLEDGNGTSLARSTFQEYVAGLPSSSSALLERMWQPTVMHHGPIAVLWTAYDFHVDGNFSHCGVDAFHLIRTNEGWKISSIVYTVERGGCLPSPLGPPGADR